MLCVPKPSVFVHKQCLVPLLDSALLSAMFNGRGKTNAIDDPDNLDPVITYRHVLSSNLGVHNPLYVSIIWS